MQQHLLTGLERGQLEHVEPGRGIHLGDCRCFLQAEAFGYRQHVAAIDHHFLGHAAAGEQGTDPIADLPGGTGAHFADDP
ncbi:hypothetical protein D3C77_569340 [compost metagenome]